MDSYQAFIFFLKYSRWNESKGRRETWPEAIDRYLTFFDRHLKKYGYNFADDIVTYNTIKNSILSLNVMPSMRALATAGPALEHDNIAGYNCAYVHINYIKVFADIMYVLMNGAGCGYSVEKKFTSMLPIVPADLECVDETIVVEDCKLGWADAYNNLINNIYNNRKIMKFDVSKIRAKGTPLKTFGGTAPGPEPLQDLLSFSTKIFMNAKGRQLKPIECHDICCKIGEITVSGGNRRSALISLSDLDDLEMMKCKSGEWWNDNPQRAMANNSACYERTPTQEEFSKEWLSLYESKSGERGIFNREAAKTAVARHARRNASYDFGCNPCSEIVLRSKQFCNLTEVVVRESDSYDDIRQKIIVATILGTFQSTLTNFNFIDEEWRNNCEEERLLGVSLTGIFDNKLMYNTKGTVLADELASLRRTAVMTNAFWAAKFGINQSTAVTCVKPSGTVSQLCNSASGIHPRHSKFYWRAVRSSVDSPITKLLQAEGLDAWDDYTKNNKVFKFPIKSPDTCITRDELDVITHLTLWKIYNENWCEHKPSITVTIKEDEWDLVKNWIYSNFAGVSGISFLPFDCGTYKHPPYESIDEPTFKRLKTAMPPLDFRKLRKYEHSDTTTSLNELACAGGACEL